MYFGDYKKFPDVTLNPKLLWEFNRSDFDYKGMRNIVVQRVIERGMAERLVFYIKPIWN